MSPPRLRVDPTALGLETVPARAALKVGAGQPPLALKLGPDAVLLESVPDPADTVLVVPVVGPQGPQGEPGAAGAGYVHTQSEASASWIIEHNLNLFPIVSVQVDGEQVIADVEYVSEDIVSIVFASPQTGTARLA